MSKVKKPKFRSAEHKRIYEENQRSWEELKAKYDTGKPVRPVSNIFSYTLSYPPGREPARIPSLDTGFGVAVRKEPMRYTGDKIKGIGIMHKSNLVPVFSDEEAADIAKMRRG